MKREFPYFYALASVWVAVPVIGLVTAYFAASVIYRPASDLYPLNITAFGVTAALASICYAIPTGAGGLTDARYAGEKFLHSSLLLIQALMVLYLKDASAASAWLGRHPSLAGVLSSLITILLVLLSAGAATAWFWGFHAVNRELWQNWEQRIRDINEANEAEKKHTLTKEG
jgi:hypothetical protein